MINTGRALALQAHAIDGGKKGHRRRLSREEKSILSNERKIKANFHSRVKKLAHAPDEPTFLKTRHMIIMDILKHLGKDLDVFDSQVAQGEPITNQALDTIPIFWMKMHHWKSSEVKFLYDVLAYKTRPQLDQEISHVFGGKKKSKKKKNQKKIERGHLRRGSRIYMSQQRTSMRNLHDKSSSAILSTGRAKAQAVAVKLWNRFVKTRGGIQECKELNEPQWNIALNDCKIIVDPDISFSLYITLLDVAEAVQSKEMIAASGDDEEAMLKKFAAKIEGHETPLPETPFGETPVPDEKEIDLDTAEKEAESESLTEEEEHARNVEKANVEKALRKRMKKTPLTPEHFRCMVIETGGVLKKNRAMRVAKPRHLSDRNRNLVIFWKSFDAILKEEQFDVMDTYLSDKLTDEELRSTKFILKELSSRKSDWKNRLAILNFVEDNLESEQMFVELIDKDDNFKAFIYGWTAQMLDDRSQLSSAAVSLFPSIVSTLIQRKDSAAPFFEDDATLLRACFEGIFTVIRGRRAAELSKLAQDSAVNVIDIFANIAEGVTENQRARAHSFSDLPTLELINSKSKKKKKDKEAKDARSVGSPEHESATLSPPAQDPGAPNPNKLAGLSLNLTAMSSEEKLDPVEAVINGGGHTRGSRSQSVMVGSKGHRRGSRIARSPTITKLASRFEGGFPDPNPASPPDKPSLKTRKSKKHIKKTGTPKPQSHGNPPPNTRITMSKTAYLDLIAVCVKHGLYQNEKHESVRAACMVLCAYLIYGIDVPKATDEGSEQSSDDASGKDKEEKKDSTAMKMNPKPSRAFLMSFDAFIGNLKVLMLNGVNDRAEVVRTKCMKLLQKLENTFGASNMDKLFDNEVIYKFRKWVGRQKYAAGKGKGKAKSKGARSRGESRAAMAKMRQKMLAEKKKKGGS